MPSDEKKRWQEISPYLDEALDLDEQARVHWLRELDERAPTIAEAVRSLIAGQSGLTGQPLLSEDRTAGAVTRNGLAGQQLGAYTLDSILGHGGMGTVWLARRSDGRYEGHVAMKLLNSALIGRPAEQRFVREGSVLARLRHPNIAQLVDAGVAPSGQPYLVLEYVKGVRFDQYAEERNLDIEDRLKLFLDVLGAVAHAHSHLIVHRDIKPSNILVTPDGVVKLLDFGVAALLGPEDAQLTRESAAGLTPEYAAPEQLLLQPVTTATDVYALGLVLFVLLAGKHPLGGEAKSVPEMARATLDVETPRPSDVAINREHGRSLRGDLDNIVAKALRKKPEERYSTAEIFAQDLRNFLSNQPVSAQPDTLGYRARKFIRRHRGSVAASLTLALVLIGATILTTVLLIEARKQRDAAVYQSRRAEFQSRFAYQILSEVGKDGQPITIRQLMQRGIEILETQYGDEPRFVIGSLVNMSGRYMDIGDTNGEYRALVKATELARKTGDPERIAYVQCNTVETELALGKPEAARQRMQDALANLAKLSEVSYDRKTDCGLAQARLLWSEGKFPEAIEAIQTVAVTIERANKAASDVTYQSASSMLEILLAYEGRHREALEWNQRGTRALERADRKTTFQMGNSEHNRAKQLYDLGEARAALDLQRSIVEWLIKQQGEQTLRAAFFARYGLYIVRVEETDNGFKWLDRGVEVATSRNNRLDQIGSLLSRAQAYVLRGRLDPAMLDLETAEKVATGNPSENADALRNVHFIRAQIHFAKQENEAALRELNTILTQVGYPSDRVANRLATVLTLKARTERALGRNAEALTSVRDAVSIAEASALHPDRSVYVGAALATLAEVQRATGDAVNANRSAQRAATVLAASLGSNHSETRAAQQFQ